MTIDSTVRIDDAGRITLPSAIRERLNLLAGAMLSVNVVADRIKLIPNDVPPRLVRRGDRLVVAPTGTPFDAAAAVRTERDARGRRDADDRTLDPR